MKVCNVHFYGHVEDSIEHYKEKGLIQEEQYMNEMHKILEDKINKIQESDEQYSGSWSNCDYNKYLEYLYRRNTYIEASPQGKKYLAVRDIDYSTDRGLTRGVGVYATGYYQLVEESDHKGK
jgi:CRISPR/Cas system-associated endonuclease/helicase Cas3